MKLTASEDIDAPIEKVFEQVSDFEYLERTMLRRGVDVRRTDNLTRKAAGMAWTGAFDYRDRRRKFDICIREFEAPFGFKCDAEGQGLNVDVVIDLVSLTQANTRLSVELVLHPKSLSARLMVQSLKLAKNKLQKRFRQRLAEFASEIEARVG